MWNYIKQQYMQNSERYHLMVLGGDQVYSDDVFAASEELRKWNFAKKGMAKEKAVRISYPILSYPIIHLNLD